MASKHVLVVDDDPQILEVITRSLCSRDFRISTARRVSMARDVLARHKIDLVLTDARIPGETGLRLGGALWWFWLLRGYVGEGRRWLDEALAAAPGGPAASSSARARALCGAGVLSWWQADTAPARQLAEESVAVCRAAGDDGSLGRSLIWLGQVTFHAGDYALTRALGEEALARSRSVGDIWGSASALHHMGVSVLAGGDPAQAGPLFDASLALYGEAGERFGMAMVRWNQGQVARASGDLAAAAACYEEMLRLHSALGFGWGIAFAQMHLGLIARHRGRSRQAAGLYAEALTSFQSLGDHLCTVYALEGMAASCDTPDLAARAVRLLGAAAALREAVRLPILPYYRPDYEQALEGLRARLGEGGFALAWAEGGGLGLDAAVADALAMARELGAERSAGRGQQPSGRLTPRELDVLRLIAAGRSNREIAELLVLSERTVERHIADIYREIGVRGRAGRAVATAYALTHGLTAAPSSETG